MSFTGKVFAGTALVIALTTLILERQAVSFVEGRLLDGFRRRVADETVMLVNVAGPALLADVVASPRSLAPVLPEERPDRLLPVIPADGRRRADAHGDAARTAGHGAPNTPGVITFLKITA